MESSYQRLAKLRDETEFQLRMLKRWMKENEKEPAIILMKNKLKELMQLYEIE